MDSENKVEQNIEFRKGVFVVTEEEDCPLYNVGEEMAVEYNWITMPIAKSTCLILAEDIKRIATDDIAYEQQGFGEKSLSVSNVEAAVMGRYLLNLKKKKSIQLFQ